MRRRAFIAGLVGATASLPLMARAQQTKIIGFVNNGSAEAYSRALAAFRLGLAKAGYTEGQNLTVEYRWADGQDDRLPGLTADLVRRGVAVIAATGGTNTALTAKASTETIPIVFVIGADPVRFGLVASLNRPGGNITGASFLANALLPKHLELLHEIIRAPVKVGLLVNPVNPNAERDTKQLAAAAAGAGDELVVIQARTRDEIEQALNTLDAHRVAALVIFPDALFTSARSQIAAAARRYGIATIYNSRELPASGGLMGYGPDQTESYRQAGEYVGRILAGAKASDLPVTLPTRFELSINLATAKGLGLDIPPTLLARADEVIE